MNDPIHAKVIPPAPADEIREIARRNVVVKVSRGRHGLLPRGSNGHGLRFDGYFSDRFGSKLVGRSLIILVVDFVVQ